MIWIDYAISGLIAISAIIGLVRGFVREAFALLTWAVAIWVGFTFSRNFSGFLESTVSYPSARIALSFAVLFFLTLIIGSLVGFLMGELVKKTGLTGSDRFLGMIFGIARGVLVVAVLVVLGGLTPLPEDPWWRESKLIPPFQSAALWLRNRLPEGMAGYVKYR
ncbi:MAG: CvpA family protein [Gammaproteobacteria bacterium]